MTVEDLGYNDTFEKLRKEKNLSLFELGPTKPNEKYF